MSDTVTRLPYDRGTRERRKHVLHRVHPTSDLVVLTGTTILGRKQFPDDPAMSSEHLELIVDGGVRVRDLRSKNGTWRFGVRIERGTLVSGDVLRLGDSLFVYRHEPVELLDADVPALVGQSRVMRELRARIAEVAGTRATVLLLGETGTGKTLAARALHALSQRRGELIHVNCAAIPESVAESTLFGHKAGAFTDARTDSPGLFRAAHRGTLFLDELGLLTPASQGRLLLAVESGAVTPVGGTTPIQVDVRLVVATNADLRDIALFRRDLYARLAEIVIHLPPLRERREDILPLLQRALGKGAPPLNADAADRLLCWHWPFNVREVEKLATDLSIRAAGLREIGPELLGRIAEPDTAEALFRDEVPESMKGPPDRGTLGRLLTEVNGNVTELSRRIGRSTKQIYRWCAKYGLNPEDFRKAPGDPQEEADRD